MADQNESPEERKAPKPRKKKRRPPRQVREDERRLEAFEYYYALGRERSLSKVAKQYGVSLAAAQLWSRKFNWSDRVKDRDERVRAEIDRRATRAEVGWRERQLRIVRAIQGRFAMRLKNQEIDPDTRDAIRAAQHELLLLGQATQRTEVGLTRDTVREMVANIVNLLRRKIPDTCPHCRTALDLKGAIAQDLLDLSERLERSTPGAVADRAPGFAGGRGEAGRDKIRREREARRHRDPSGPSGERA